MADHSITPEELRLAIARHAPARSPESRPSPIARLIARIRACDYDRLLAVGVFAEPGSALSVHRARLASRTERRAISASLRRAVREAQQPGGSWSSRVGVNVPNVVGAEDLIDRAARRLDSHWPVGVLGMARLRLVLSDGAGPLYRFGRGDLRGRLGAALAEL